MEHLDWLLISIAGIGAGAYGVLVGAGGGFILGPVLMMMEGTDPKAVPGTVLAAIDVNAVFVTTTFYRVGVSTIEVVCYSPGPPFPVRYLARWV